jgi:hypothetical protein
LKLVLQEEDKYHLERFKQDLNCDYEVKPYKVTFRPESSRPQWSIEISRTHICKELERVFNIIPNKSLSLYPPSLEDKNNCWAFMIGLFDGDGTFQRPVNEQSNPKLSWRGTHPILQWVKEHVDTLVPYSNRNKSELPKVIKTQSIWSYTVGGERARELYNFLQGFNIPKLRRKWSYAII